MKFSFRKKEREAVEEARHRLSQKQQSSLGRELRAARTRDVG